jgi:hypothetical protein
LREAAELHHSCKTKSGMALLAALLYTGIKKQLKIIETKLGKTD